MWQAHHSCNGHYMILEALVRSPAPVLAFVLVQKCRNTQLHLPGNGIGSTPTAQHPVRSQSFAQKSLPRVGNADIEVGDASGLNNAPQLVLHSYRDGEACTFSLSPPPTARCVPHFSLSIITKVHDQNHDGIVQGLLMLTVRLPW